MTRILRFCALLVFAAAIAATPALADWRSWFHPEPAPPPKASPPKVLATVSSASAEAKNAQVEAFLAALAAAIKAREGAPMRLRLSDRYAVDTMEAGSRSADLFVLAMEQLPGPTEIVVQSVERRADSLDAKAEFRYANAAPKVKTFRFDAEGRLVWSDLFAVKMERHDS
jgi:hypothetical protein